MLMIDEAVQILGPGIWKLKQDLCINNALFISARKQTVGLGAQNDSPEQLKLASGIIVGNALGTEAGTVYFNAGVFYGMTAGGPIILSGGSATTLFTALTDTPADYVGQSLKGVRVNSGETALEFYTSPPPGASVFTSLTDTPVNYTGQGLKGVRVNSGATALEFFDVPAAGVTLFTGLTDTPANYTGAGLKGVRVNSGATALEFFDVPVPGASVFTALTDTPASYSGQTLKVLRVNSGETALEYYSLPTPITNFLGLSDTPANYTGQSLKVVRVNSGETGLEYYTLPVVITNFTGLTDTPANFTGQALKSVRVNAGATALEFFDLPVGTVHTVTGANYTITDIDGHDLILVDTGGVGRTITLPAVANNTSRSITVKKIDVAGGSVRDVTITGTGSETIDGATSRVITNQWDGLTFKTNGTAWFIL